MTQNLNNLISDVSEEDIQRNLEHEQNMIDSGVAKQKARILAEKARGNTAATAGGRVMMSRMSAVMADKIVEEIARLEDGRVKRKPPELRTLQLLPARDMAVSTLRAVTNFLAANGPSNCTTQKVGFAIGNDIESEAIGRQFHSTDRPLFERVVRQLNERSKNPEQRRKELIRAFEAISEEDTFQRLTQSEKIRLGAFLLGLLTEMGVVEASVFSQGKKSTKVYELSEAALKTMMNADQLQAEMKPHMYPTLIPPRPWTDLQTGGYWLTFRRGGRMVVARTKTNGIKEADELQMPRMFGPVNYLQNTPFKVNVRVLGVIEVMRESGLTCESLPSLELETVPAKPHDIETNEEARTVWRRKAREVHTRNAAAKGRILAVEKTIRLASALAEEPAIFFPKQVDFRGRVYDSPSFLKPQGDDLSKGLLTFAGGKPIDEIGAFWLAVHGANVYGNDKISLDDRADWVENNQASIFAIADDPLGNREWMEADKPFQYLAFCFEWAELAEHGYGFESCLPVAMDGSCNGLQHLSAMLRDSVGGAAVNLLPADKPQDIYTQVLDKVVEMLEERKSQGEPTAQKWLPIMKRKTVKRPVMTLPYGATRTGFADQIMEDTIRPLDKAKQSPFTSEPYAAAQYLGKLVWDATGQTVIAARQAMDWLQEVARVVAKAGQPIQWTTPSGFVVRQDYRKVKEGQVKLLVAGQRVSVRVAEGYTERLDSAKMALAIAPNFVHAMDAAHMLRTVERMLEAVGPDVHLAMVHDSYATHAADADHLAIAIRQSFVQMYQEDDWLERFRHEVVAQLPEDEAEKIPPVPEAGDLDIEEVLDSLYFFA